MQTTTAVKPQAVKPADALTRHARAVASVDRTPAPRETIASYEKGKWNQALYDEFRATKDGPQKRHLLNQLLICNEPLARIMVDQMCGRGDGSRRKGYKPMGGCQGFRDLPFEDAMQAGLIALQKALEQFDPSKRLDKHGKPNPYKPGEEFRISGYYKQKLRHELQRLVFYGGSLIRVPRGNGVEQMGVALVGDEQTMDLMSGGYEDAATADSLGITPEMIDEWERTGEWPESLESLRETLREREEDGGDDGNDETASEPEETTQPIVMLPPPRTFLSGIEAFLSNRVALRPSERVETWTAHNAYRLECRKYGFVEVVRPMFVRWLLASGLREVFVRARNKPSVRAIAGIRLV